MKSGAGPREVSRGFVFADLCGYTALTEAHGDLNAASVVARFSDVARRVLVPGAELVKTVGDEVMIATTSPDATADVALSLWRAVDDEPDFPTFSAGLHFGKCIAQGSDYFGATVNLAARVAAHARAGQMLCTRVISESIGHQDGMSLRCLGPLRFRHIFDEVEVWEISHQERPVPSGFMDPVCRMRVDPARAQARLIHGGVEFFFCSLACIGAFSAQPDRYLRHDAH